MEASDAARARGICCPGVGEHQGSRGLEMMSSSDIFNSKVLIVDDREANVRLLERMLVGAGYTTIQSTMNPREVCELHRQNHYDLILLDLAMPDMDGFQVMEGLKEVEAEGYLPVLVITANPEYKLRALQAGAKDFISKPLDLAEVQARAYNMLEVRLLHQETKKHSLVLEQTVRELEASREVIRLKTLEERKKLEQELAWAQQTQKSLLPRFLPQFENYRVHAFNSPARFVAGDFYDFVQLSSGEWVGILADVSGKGMSAALVSSLLLGVLSMEFRSGIQPPEVLSRVNQLLCEKSLPYEFVMLFLYLLSPQGVGQFISAGHDPAYLFRSATGKIEELSSGGLILGAFPSTTYQSCPLYLHPGDILVVYSDGLTEAQNLSEEMFGKERLLRIIQQEAPSGSNALQEKIFKAIEEFTFGERQTDDITFLVVEKYQ
jgi:serine phosphatase RsbU (regulator of sigma subunit)